MVVDDAVHVGVILGEIAGWVSQVSEEVGAYRPTRMRLLR
jgi:hypothetical protein